MRCPASSRLAALLLLLSCFAAWPVVGRTETYSGASAYSSDEIFDPPNFVDDVGFDESSVPGVRVTASASTCLTPCVLVPPHVSEAEAEAETDYGSNRVDVFSQSYSTGSNSAYYDDAGAESRWEDELVFESSVPGTTGTIRATYRVRGHWNNSACFSFVGFLYDPASETGCSDVCCPCFETSSVVRAGNQATDSICTAPTSFGDGLPPAAFPDLGEEDGEIDLTVSVEVPLILDQPIRLGGALGAYAGGFDHSSFDAPGVSVTVENLVVPVGVTVDSSANAESAYHIVPEPGIAPGVLAAGVVLAVLSRPRRVRKRPKTSR